MTEENSRRLLGFLFLWSLLPFPFLYIVVPPFWIVALVVALFIIFRPSATLRPSTAVLNLIGIAIIIVVAVAGGMRVGPLRPLGHLLLLLTSVRVLSVTDRRSFVRATLLVFLVWMVALTSSTHVVVALYFAASAVLWWWAGMVVHISGLGFERAMDLSIPRPRHVVVAATLALLLSIPIFLALPRLRSPWIAGHGGLSSVTGFTSHVDLAGVGTIRQSHQVALIVRSVSGDAIRPEWMRLRATALQRVTLDSWAPRGAFLVPDDTNGLIRLHAEGRRLADAIELEIEIVHPRRYLFLPEGTIAFSSPVAVNMDPAGGVVLASRFSGPLIYSVWVTSGDPPRATDPPQAGAPRFVLDPGVRQLALDIIRGAHSDAERATAIEDFLKDNYKYSLNGMTHQRADPVSWFLLHERQGYCEYFAGAMVALLRDLEIPARMVAGYSGGSLSFDGEEAVIRQANAHTWVEAWVGGNHWSVFDPTPEGSIPILSRPSGRERIRWAAEWVQSAWDRYVLTFGFGEQVRLASAVTNGLEALLRRISWRHLAVIAAFLGLIAITWWLERGRQVRAPRPGRATNCPAAAALDRLAIRVDRRNVEVPPSATVRWVAKRARDLWPSAGAAIFELAWLAERELYAAEGSRYSDRAVVRALWTRVVRAIRSTD